MLLVIRRCPRARPAGACYGKQPAPKVTYMTPLSMSVNTAARAIGIGRTKLYELINSGKVDTIKIGRRTLITKASLDRLVNGEAN